MLRHAARGPGGASARLAVQLLNQATARQAARIDGNPALGPAAVCTMRAADIPDTRDRAAASPWQDSRYL